MLVPAGGHGTHAVFSYAQQVEIGARSDVTFAAGDLLVVTALRFSHRLILPSRHCAQQPNDRANQACPRREIASHHHVPRQHSALAVAIAHTLKEIIHGRLPFSCYWLSHAPRPSLDPVVRGKHER